MALSELTIRLLLLFFPGIVCFLIVETLTIHRERKTHEVIFFTFLYGMLSYLCYGALLYACSIRCSTDPPRIYTVSSELSFFNALTADGKSDAKTDGKQQLDFWEILSVAACAIGLGFILSGGHNKKLLHRFARRIGVSHKMAEPTIWNYAFDAPGNEWCLVRDLTNKLMFQGYVAAFSDVDEPAELVLTDVIVYNEETGEEIYRAERLYLARKKEDWTIVFEIPTEPKGEPENEKQGNCGPDTAAPRIHREEGRSEPAEHEQSTASEAEGK